MIKLPESFEKWGYTWTVLKREGDIALIEQSSDSFSGYNVVKVRKNKEFSFGENTVPAKESIPSPEQWGTYAWNFGRDYDLAVERYKSLIN